MLLQDDQTWQSRRMRRSDVTDRSTPVVWCDTRDGAVSNVLVPVMLYQPVAAHAEPLVARTLMQQVQDRGFADTLSTEHTNDQEMTTLIRQQHSRLSNEVSK